MKKYTYRNVITDNYLKFIRMVLLNKPPPGSRTSNYI